MLDTSLTDSPKASARSARSRSEKLASAFPNASSQLLASAFELAYFIHPDTGTALRIATDALANLEFALQAQDKRLYYSPVGQFFSRQHSSLKLRNRVRVSDLHLLQRLVYIESEAHERDHEMSGRRGATREDLIIRFIKHVVKITIRRNSFYVALGFSRLLHSYSTPETMDIYNLLIQDPSRMKHDSYYRTCKKQLMRELKQRFGPALKTVTAARGEERFETEQDPASLAALARKALAMFTPWNTGCLIPESLDASEDSLSGLRFEGDDPDKEHPIEINRIHSIIEPVCYARIIKALGLQAPEQRLALPKFCAGEQEGDGRGGRANREQPPELSDEQISGALKELADRADRRKKTKAKMLLVVVDGIERARMAPTSGARAVLEVDESAEMIEVRARDEEGEARVGLHLLDYHDDETGEPRSYRVEMEGGQRLSLEMRVKRSGIGEVEGALISIEYEEAKLLATAKQYLRQMKEAGKRAGRLAEPSETPLDGLSPGFVIESGAAGTARQARDILSSRETAPVLLLPRGPSEGEGLIDRLMPGATPEALRVARSSKLLARLLTRDMLRAANMREARLKLSYLLIELAEQSHSRRDTRTFKEAGELLLSIPIEQARGAGLLFKSILDKKEGEIDRARGMLEGVIADPKALPYIKARGMSNLAASYYMRGDMTEAVRIYEESFLFHRTLSKPHPYSFLISLVEFAKMHAEMGNLELAVRMLMESLPLTEIMGQTRPHLKYLYLNNIAAQLMLLGKTAEAAHYIRPACFSPLASRYPEWRETAMEIKEASGKDPLER